MQDVYPVLSCAEARDFEKTILLDESAQWEAMVSAGHAVARAVRRDFTWWKAWPASPRVLILAGKGHNTGDALLAVNEWAKTVDGLTALVVHLEEESERTPLMERSLELLVGTLGKSLETIVWSELENLPRSKVFDLTLDGMVGMNFQGPLREPMKTVLKWCDSHAGRLGFRVSIDLPSGMGDEPKVEAAFHADVTYATGVVKAPLLRDDSPEWAGRIRFLNLGFFEHQGVPQGSGDFIVSRRILERMGRLRPSFSDKRSFGQIFAIGGSRRTPGAILMAAHAAIRSGSGLVTAMVPAYLSNRMAGAVPEVMWHPLPATPDAGFMLDAAKQVHHAVGDRGVLLMGPGMHVDRNSLFVVARLVREITLPIVLDAGALSGDVIGATLSRPKNAGPVILTPHMGEYNRMLGQSDGGYDRATFVEFAKKYQVIVILKGPVTRITDGEQVLHLPNGSPVLARGGSGDILAGLVASRLAANPEDGLLAAVEAVMWHSRSADLLARVRGEIAVKSTELLEYLAPALRGA